ncbi:MAG: hypothetical protein HY584_04975, partial [Candidatus Omnitrophica bacterium]|nr:hypothetical protein [Candidatus Omnitrophota bacterium]
IHRSELTFYDTNYKRIKTIELPQPLPLHYEVPISEIPPHKDTLHYQLSVYDSKGNQDRTSVGRIALK